MAEKETIPQKAVRLSTDAYVEDSALISQIMADLKLDSRKEAIHILCNRYRDDDDAESGETENSKCDVLVKEGAGLFCVENYEKPKKTTVEKCRVCLKAQKNRERQEERAEIRRLGERVRYDMYLQAEYNFFQRLGVPVGEVHNGVALFNSKLDLMHIANQCLDKLNAELQELKKPIEEKLKEIATLKSQNGTLETDNTYLRKQLDELKRDTLFEENIWLKTELRERNKEIEQLKTDVNQKDALIERLQGNAKTP